MVMPHAHRLRKGRYSEANRIYAITIATLDRKPLFADFHHARLLIQVLRESAQRQRAQTLCFVIMPDHFHWLMQLGEGKSLSQVVGTVKSLSSRCIGQAIWQKGFYDHAIRKEEDIKPIARYMVANPIRAKLVSSIGQYPHWNAIWL
jgi:REP element-mobilizing transposase RayT